ncbi:MAG: phage holin family protein [Clostridia bacterium]|nr:phage holin family protein [Clostridia bacterium]
MFHDLIMQILLAVITLVVPIIAAYIVNLLRAKIGNANFDKMYKWASIGVHAFEQAIGDGNGAQKKKEVEIFLANKLKGVTPDDMDKLIEAVVASMNKDKKKEVTQCSQTQD